MSSLPKTVTRQRRNCDLNPGPSVPESSTLTTRLPSHPCHCMSANQEPGRGVFRNVTWWADDVTGLPGRSPSSSPIMVVTGLASGSRSAAAVFTRSRRTYVLYRFNCTPHHINKPVVDTRLRSCPVLPRVESIWYTAVSCRQLPAILCKCEVIHPRNRKQIAYRNAARGGPSHGHRLHAQTREWL